MKKSILLLLAFLFAGYVAVAQHTATTEQSGDDNVSTIKQSGVKGSNNAEVTQSGDDNMADITQKGDSPFDSPLGPSGFTNHVFLKQLDGSKAIISQTGRDYVNLEQADASIAEIKQDFGELQIVRGIDDLTASQSGGSELYVRQQGTLELGSSGVRRLGSELRIEQESAGDGHITDIKQRDGALSQILQQGLDRSSTLIRQDGDSDIYLNQNGTAGSSADITQNGDGNLVTGLAGGTSYALQGDGGGHTLTVDQTSPFGGTGNTAEISQLGSDQTATVTQNGTGNTATVNQSN